MVERIAGGRAAIGEQDGPVCPAIEAIAEHFARFGRAHRQRSHRAAIEVANLQRRFQGVEILRIENCRKRGAVDRSVFLHGLGRDIGRVGHLFDANYTIVWHWNTFPRENAGVKLT